ncbi:16S rRNA (cytosine(1402)-N(4))-methyltransferase RsmH [Casaltella massiliensis]|nr:16S rRNA (cytosine(1402)-N(4))-methyltransferase RsmH [Casaltella massiliensis]
MEFRHRPVMLEQCVKGLDIRPDGIYVDGTLGGGGHSGAICRSLDERGALIGIDRDRDALNVSSERLKEYKCQKYFVQSNYSDIKQVLNELKIEKVDGALLDLGVSSFQLDNPQRGFSYMNDAPLDMRMSQDDDFTAYDIVNDYDRNELIRVIGRYGEERWASRIADFIVKVRSDKPIESTYELVDVIKQAIPASARRTGPHPAKRTFQAIRIEVNDELSQLERAVEEFCDILAPGGRLCIITFHSLEDRIVKEIFSRRANPCTCPREFPICVCGKKADIKKITGKPFVPDAEETEENPRARSAKLRIAEKI